MPRKKIPHPNAVGQEAPPRQDFVPHFTIVDDDGVPLTLEHLAKQAATIAPTSDMGKALLQRGYVKGLRAAGSLLARHAIGMSIADRVQLSATLDAIESLIAVTEKELKKTFSHASG